jgi:hypothetical protein
LKAEGRQMANIESSAEKIMGFLFSRWLLEENCRKKRRKIS